MARSRTRMTVDASPTLPANDAEPDAPVAQEDRYTNRELSWLSFNRRVLAESENESYPLLERLRFLSISASNLDEFTMVRIAGLEGQVQRGIETQAIDGASPRQQLAAIREQLLQLEDRQQASLDTLSVLLAEEGIILAPVEALSDEQQGWLAAYFESDILPLITPQAIDPSHPFPFVANKGIGVIFRLKRGKRQADLIEMVLIPSGAPRFVRVPGTRWYEQLMHIDVNREKWGEAQTTVQLTDLKPGRYELTQIHRQQQSLGIITVEPEGVLQWQTDKAVTGQLQIFKVRKID